MEKSKRKLKKRKDWNKCIRVKTTLTQRQVGSNFGLWFGRKEDRTLKRPSTSPTHSGLCFRSDALRITIDVPFSDLNIILIYLTRNSCSNLRQISRIWAKDLDHVLIAYNQFISRNKQLTISRTKLELKMTIHHFLSSWPQELKRFLWRLCIDI